MRNANEGAGKKGNLYIINSWRKEIEAVGLRLPLRTTAFCLLESRNGADGSEARNKISSADK